MTVIVLGSRERFYREGEEMVSPEERIKELKERALKAVDKPALYGPDIDLAQYSCAPQECSYVEDLSDIRDVDPERLARAGVEITGRGRSGSFVQLDNTIVHRKALEKGVEILGTTEALQKYEWAWDYFWKVVQVDADKYTADVELNGYEGYFIRALPGSRTIYPLQACLYIRSPRVVQRVHNIIIAEEDSELHIITGCASDHRVEMALHLGISEFYVKR
ncbi:MAG: hypothetical protein WHT46_05250, partial [Candidatus Geothermincolales bacterium]